MNNRHLLFEIKFGVMCGTIGEGIDSAIIANLYLNSATAVFSYLMHQKSLRLYSHPRVKKGTAELVETSDAPSGQNESRKTGGTPQPLAAAPATASVNLK